MGRTIQSRSAGVEVLSARIMEAGEADGSRKPAPLATPRRIAVTFSTPHDLAVARADEGLDFITAKMFACEAGGASTDEVVTQAGNDPLGAILGDYGRVVALPPPASAAGRYAYRVVFDDRLTTRVGSRFQDRPAIGTPGGLCFALDGASMWIGKAWSNRVPLRLPVR